MSVTEALQQQFDAAMEAFGPCSKLGLAVSGGGDSVAMLRLADHWARRNTCELLVAIVDHGLRQNAKLEAAQACAWARDLGVRAEILTWNGQVKNNLQADAREARRALLADWAARHDIQKIALGHTKDDQAETFLMRLARGSGVNGLAAMPSESQARGVTWIRPMLNMRRDELRTYLRSLGQDWIDDPSNDDQKFDRVRMRQAQDQLDALGLTVDRLAKTAAHMYRAKEALNLDLLSRLEDVVSVSKFGSIRIQRNLLSQFAQEHQLRLVAACIQLIGAKPYPPRLEATKAMLDDIFLGSHGVLGGVLCRLEREDAYLMREPSAVGAFMPKTSVFDGRWQVDAPELNVRALGQDGLAQIPNWRESGQKRDLLVTLPSAWRGEQLVAAPILFEKQEVRFKCMIDMHALKRVISSH